MTNEGIEGIAGLKIPTGRFGERGVKKGREEQRSSEEKDIVKGIDCASQ